MPSTPSTHHRSTRCARARPGAARTACACAPPAASRPVQVCEVDKCKQGSVRGGCRCLDEEAARVCAAHACISPCRPRSRALQSAGRSLRLWRRRRRARTAREERKRVGRSASWRSRCSLSHRLRTRKLKGLRGSESGMGGQQGGARDAESRQAGARQERKLESCWARGGGMGGAARGEGPPGRTPPPGPRGGRAGPGLHKPPAAARRAPAGPHQRRQQRQRVRHHVHDASERVLQHQAADVAGVPRGGVGRNRAAQRAAKEHHLGGRGGRVQRGGVRNWAAAAQVRLLAARAAAVVAEQSGGG